MAWWNFLKEWLYRSILKRPKERDGGVASRVALRPAAIDQLYGWLGTFTHLYGATVAVLFFARSAARWPTLISLLDALQEPYLGGLGVYVVLKEIRKRTRHEQSRHYGELFVAGWLLLLLISTVLVTLTPAYRFDSVYKIIITNSLATLIIYIGGLIAKP